jgi:lipoyl(octanoyl) transferase
VEDRKIASIGVHVSRAITTHGFAVNVENDLEPFSWVIACGLPDVTMTSVQRELSPTGCDPNRLRRGVTESFCSAHGKRKHRVSSRELGIEDLQEITPSHRLTVSV